MNTKFLALLVLALLGLTMVSALSSTNTLRRRVGLRNPEQTLGEGSDEAADGEGEGSADDSAEAGAEGEATGEAAEDSESSEGGEATELVGGEGCEDCNKKDTGAAVDEAVAPVSDWLKAFRKRTGNTGDLYQIAEASVKPLVDRLSNQQQLAVEKLQRSNDAILQHVRQTATEHIYELLQNSKAKEDKEEATEKAVEKKAAEKEEMENAKDVAKLKADEEVDA